MSTRDPFRFDHERFTASLDLRPEHHAEFQRLVKVLRYGTRSQFLILEFSDEPYRNLLIRRVDDVLAVERLRSTSIDLVRSGFPTFADALKILLTSTVPSNLCVPSALRPAEAMQPHCEQSGFPPNWQGEMRVLRSAV